MTSRVKNLGLTEILLCAFFFDLLVTYGKEAFLKYLTEVISVDFKSLSRDDREFCDCCKCPGMCVTQKSLRLNFVFGNEACTMWS